MNVNTAPSAARADGDSAELLLAAVPARLRPHVRTLLATPRLGGRGPGSRSWKWTAQPCRRNCRRNRSRCT